MSFDRAVFQTFCKLGVPDEVAARFADEIIAAIHALMDRRDEIHAKPLATRADLETAKAEIIKELARANARFAALDGDHRDRRIGLSCYVTRDPLSRIASTHMLADVLSQHTVHAGLPAFASRTKVFHDLDAVAHRQQQLFSLGLGPASRNADRHKRIKLGHRQRLGIRINLGRSDNFRVVLYRRHQDHPLTGCFRHIFSPLVAQQGAD